MVEGVGPCRSSRVVKIDGQGRYVLWLMYRAVIAQIEVATSGRRCSCATLRCKAYAARLIACVEEAFGESRRFEEK